jgi:hypothetical protein
MNSTVPKLIILASILFAASGSAHATISTIKGSLTCFLGCNKNVVQLIPQGEDMAFEVVGDFVDLSTAVEITGSGVSVSYGTRKHGNNSSIIVRFDVSSGASTGERTVKMRYAIETNGPDTFKVRVVKRGSITDIKYRRPLQLAANAPLQARPGIPTSGITFPGAGSGTPPTQLVEPTDIPINEVVVLVVSGTRLSGVELRTGSRHRNVRIRPGGTDSSFELEIEFTSSGQEQLLFFDSHLSQSDMNSGTSSNFSYTGGANRTVQYGGGATNTGGTFTPPITGGGSTGPATFVDAAPRANLLNIFRRQGANPVFTENGVQYFNAPNSTPGFCSGMTGTQTKVITIPHPVWGVSNVGTANITTPFDSQLRAGNQLLATETITTLSTGQTRDFTFQRPGDSRVRVFTFLARGGCFISPQADEFFEDPLFTVTVNTNGALVEAQINQANNTRNY